MAQVQKPQPAPKPALRLVQKPAPKPAPKPAARSLATPSKPAVAQKPKVGALPHGQKPAFVVTKSTAPSTPPDGTALSCDLVTPTSGDHGETTMKPQPRAKKRKSLQKQHPPRDGDETDINTEITLTHTSQGDSTITARQIDQNANVVERHVYPDICNDGQETESISNDPSCETVMNKETSTAQTEGSTGLAQHVRPKVKVKPQVPAKPKPAQWKSVSSAESETTTESKTSGEAGATEAPSNTESSQSNGDTIESSVPCSTGSTLDPSNDSSITLGDSPVSLADSSITLQDTDIAVSAAKSSLRRSGSYEAAVVSEDLYYDDVVCPPQQTVQDTSVVDDMTMTRTDTMTEDDTDMNDTDNYYSELADCREGDGDCEGVGRTVDESDTDEGLCDDTGGVYSYADVPLGSSDAEAGEQPETATKERETKDQKKQTTGLGISFRAFFRGKLGGGKKEKVRKTSNSSFYHDAKQETAGTHSMDSSVHPIMESDSSEYDADHDYIYIDDLNESEVSSDDKAAVDRGDNPPTLKSLAAQHSECENRKEDLQPERPLPRIPLKRNAATVKAQPTVHVQRSQSDSVPVLPPRRKRNASRKAMLDVKVVVQRRREPSRSDDDNEYIIPEYDARTDAPQEESAELLEDEDYLIPQPAQGDSSVSGSACGEMRDSEDYVLPQDIGATDSKGEWNDGDYLVPLSQDDKKEVSGSEDKDNDGDYLEPVSVIHEKILSDTVSPCHLTVSPCHLSDSESDDDDYVRPGCQDLSSKHGVDCDSQCLDSQHSSVSQEDVEDPSSSRVLSDMSTDMSSESGYYINDGRMSLSHNDLHRVMPSLLHPTVMSLKRRSFPGSGTYSNCSVPVGDGYGGLYVPMDSTGEYADSHGSGSSFSESHSDTSDYEAVGVRDSPIKEVKQRSVTHIVQEIASSEKTFVGVLRLLNERFRSAVDAQSHHHGRPVLPQVILDQILKYLPMLQDFNTELLKDIEERLANWEADPRIADIFVKKGPFLKLYTSYIREFEMMCNTLEEARRKYPVFDRVVTDFEMSALCAGLALKHYMLKPIQRIPQYRLLLQEYKKSVSSDAVDYKDILTALVIVSEVADHANESMQYRDNVGKLLEIQNSLISRCEVIKPGRFLLKEGILMKLSRKEMQPRRFILLNDALLYTTQVSGGYKLNNELPLSGMKVSKPLKEAFQNEFSIISTRRSFTISARTSEERDEWLEALQKAIEEHQQKRYSFDLKRSHLPALAYIEMDADFKLGSRAPVWIPDARVSMCMLCTAEFTVTFRRHHCRACGKVVCRVCSDYKAPLRYLTYKPDRVCKPCYEQLHKEMSAIEDGLEETTDHGKNMSFSKSSIRDRFHGLGSFGKGKLKLKHRPSVLNEVRANADDVDISGYLKLWRKKTKRWRTLWFVLKDKAFYTYKASEDTAARKSTVVLGYEVQPLATYFQGIESNLLFQLVHRGMTPMVFQTDSQASRGRWMSALLKATVP